jgi:hypothetical protein
MPPPYHSFAAAGFIVHNCFNKSHAVAYALISYWCCWFKAHYPHEFAAATLQHEDNPERQIIMLREMEKEGIGYVPFDPALSTDKWAPAIRDGVRVLIGPWGNVKGIGPSIIKMVLASKARGDELPDRVKKLIDRPVTPLDTLWPIRDAIKKLLPNPAARKIDTLPTAIVDMVPTKGNNEFLIFCTPIKLNPRNKNEEALVLKRGHRIESGPTEYLNMRLSDDTDTIMAQIGVYDYGSIGKRIVDRNRTGKALYAMKGSLATGIDFRLFIVNRVKYIGDMDEL